MFNVGDEVIIINDEGYRITKIGSYGKVVSVSGSYIMVAFEYTPSGQKDTYSINSKHLAPRRKYTKEERICIKVAAMYNRQKERGIVHV